MINYNLNVNIFFWHESRWIKIVCYLSFHLFMKGSTIIQTSKGQLGTPVNHKKVYVTFLFIPTPPHYLVSWDPL